jgi:transposase
MKGLRAQRVRRVKEGTLIVTVDIGITSNTGYCTPLGGRSTKPFRFDNTKEGFQKFWCMTVARKNRFGCDEVLVGYESTGPYAEPLVDYLAHKQIKIVQVNPMHTKKMKEVRRGRDMHRSPFEQRYQNIEGMDARPMPGKNIQKLKDLIRAIVLRKLKAEADEKK